MVGDTVSLMRGRKPMSRVETWRLDLCLAGREVERIGVSRGAEL